MIKSISRSIILLFFWIIVECLFVHALVNPVYAEDLELINRPVNASGLTGLLFTTSPYTLPQNTMEIGASMLVENSVLPEYTITEYPLTISYGLSQKSELGFKASYYHIKEVLTTAATTTTTTTTEWRTGDLELSYKRTILSQPEFSMRPALALIIAGSAPTNNNNRDNTINSIAHWSMRMGIAAGTEINWRDHVLGIYGDIQVKGQDLTEPRLRDVYGIANMGLLFPISKYQNLQMFFEYSIVNGKEIITLDGGDYSAFTYGLRLVSEQFNFTIGTQFLHKTIANYDNSGRVVMLTSMKF